MRLIPAIAYKRDLSDLLLFGERSQKKLHPYVQIVLLSIIAQVALLTTTYIIYGIKNKFGYLLPEGFIKLFAQPDGMAFGGNMINAVSSTGLLSFILPQNMVKLTYWCYIPILTINSLAMVASPIFLYELVICDHSKRCAKFSVLLLHVLPSALLLMQPFSGTALFFAFSLLALLLARRKKSLEAGIAAFAAALFNIFAVCLAVPIAIEFDIHAKTRAAAEVPECKTLMPSAKAYLGIAIAIIPLLIGTMLRAAGLSGLNAFDGKKLLSSTLLEDFLKI